MRALPLIFKKLIQSENLIYFLYGLVLLLFKFINKVEIILILFILILLNNYLIRIKFIEFKVKRNIIHELKNLNWVLIPVFIYSFFLSEKLLGLLLIANIFSDRMAAIMRNTHPTPSPLRIPFLKKDLGGTLVFLLTNFFLSLLFFYYTFGYLIVRDVLMLLFISFLLALLENIKIAHVPDNFNINIFGSIIMALASYIDFHFRFSTINLIFGSLICFIILIIFVLFDLIELKKSYQFYLLFVLFYTSLGYFLFIFNVFILLCMSIVHKIKFNNFFVPLKDIKNYFYLSCMVVLLYLIMPHIKIMKMGLVVGLIPAFLLYAHGSNIIFNFNATLQKNKLFSQLSKFFTRLLHKIKIIQTENLFFNNLFSIICLTLAYFLNLIPFLYILYGLIIINLTLFLFDFIHERHYLNYQFMKFFIVYIPFKIIILINI